MPQLLDPDDHRFGTGPPMLSHTIDRLLVPAQYDEVTALATIQSAAMLRSSAV
jgi:hypothetical protein